MMTLVEDRAQWVAHVAAVQQGDTASWPAIIDRFEDLAVATAVGLCGNLDDAPDIAQDAFVLAFRHINDLKDPVAFPAWLLRLVRTATNRRTRRRRLSQVPLHDATTGAHSEIEDNSARPDELVLGAIERAEVRAAVERLPEGERCVIALHYLAGMPYADVADFLGISTSAAKKRAWSARSRLKELLPMVADELASARPSGTSRFRDTILVFQAIRSLDVDALAALLQHNPLLATASEDWAPAEGFESRLGYSEQATALIRAAGTGELELVRLLVEAGAPVSERCGCVDHESALVAAINIGAIDVVDYLLDQGAAVDGGCFDGESTPLHVAVHRERPELVERLLAAGADPAARDLHGRTAADWQALKGPGRQAEPESDVLWTRIRAIDLFAPLQPGALVHVPPAYGVGAMRAQFGVVDACGAARWWMIGFENGPYEPTEFEIEARECGIAATVALTPPGAVGDRRAQFAASISCLQTDLNRKVVTCVPAPGHEHDITMALPGLAADRSVVVTFVMSAYDSEPAVIPNELPEGIDARLAFNGDRARAGIWPAIDPARTSAKSYPDARHEQLADAARRALTAYVSVDPAFALPDPHTLPDPRASRRAQALIGYLRHSFRPFEMLRGTPAPDTPIPELLDAVEQILHD